MTQEGKQLLLKDLCARLPFGVMVLHQDENGRKVTTKLSGYNGDWYNYYIDNLCYHLKLHEFKPYLRPMSSMTEEEEIEISKILNYEFYLNCDGGLTAEGDRHSISMMIINNYINFLLSHHFDFRRIWDGYEEKSMIEKGLALEAPDGMYNLEKK